MYLRKAWSLPELIEPWCQGHSLSVINRTPSSLVIGMAEEGFLPESIFLTNVQPSLKCVFTDLDGMEVKLKMGDS